MPLGKRIAAALLAVLVLTVPAWAESGAVESARAFYGLFVQGDPAAGRYVSAETRPAFERSLSAAREMAAGLRFDLSGLAWAVEFENAERARVTAQGRVTITSAQGTETIEDRTAFDLVKEGGQWRIQARLP